ASPKRDEREVGIELLERANRVGGEIVIGDKGYAGKDFATAVSDLEATIVRPARKDEPDSPIHLAPIRQRIESIFWTCKDMLTLERRMSGSSWKFDGDPFVWCVTNYIVGVKVGWAWLVCEFARDCRGGRFAVRSRSRAWRGLSSR
ncbi:MAG: transposase, partial [Solirubrobacteraceae bacterium]